MVQGYQGGIRYQNRIWQPVKEKLKEWRNTYMELHRVPGAGPILSYPKFTAIIAKNRKNRLFLTGGCL